MYKLFIICFCIFLARTKIEEPKVNDSLSTALEVIRSYNIKFDTVVLCQMIHETGYFSSKVYKENHNPFGMKHSNRGYSIGSNLGHAKYRHDSHKGSCTWSCLEDPLMDYAGWQRRWGIPSTIVTSEDYIWYLQHLPGGYRYAEDKLYESKLKQHLNLIRSWR